MCALGASTTASAPYCTCMCVRPVDNFEKLAITIYVDVDT